MRPAERSLDDPDPGACYEQLENANTKLLCRIIDEINEGVVGCKLVNRIARLTPHTQAGCMEIMDLTQRDGEDGRPTLSLCVDFTVPKRSRVRLAVHHAGSAPSVDRDSLAVLSNDYRRLPDELRQYGITADAVIAPLLYMLLNEGASEAVKHLYEARRGQVVTVGKVKLGELAVGSCVYFVDSSATRLVRCDLPSSEIREGEARMAAAVLSLEGIGKVLHLEDERSVHFRLSRVTFGSDHFGGDDLWSVTDASSANAPVGYYHQASRDLIVCAPKVPPSDLIEALELKKFWSAFYEAQRDLHDVRVSQITRRDGQLSRVRIHGLDETGEPVSRWFSLQDEKPALSRVSGAGRRRLAPVA